ncbi:MAG: hypothetical protein KKF41_16030 [Actinobacteria bacterium]|nr:hypothetical protein [Actinomycetota bacterium]MBU1944535.1 hypothetical protein [Actinomycetota bacterium]MBU2689088.1 hypothetical protein [Actinomycetota bacterium]
MSPEERKVQPRRIVTWLIVFSVVAAVLAAMGIGFVGAVLVALFLVALLLKVDPWLPLAASLLAMVLSALILAVNQPGAANALATLAFFFFALAMVRLLVISLSPREIESDGED